MDITLHGREALVCGSTQGIGKACAIELAKLGANVTLVARNEQKLHDTLKELDISQGQQHDSLAADFSFPNQLERALLNFLSKGRKVNILVNNTGGPAGGPIKEASVDAFLSAFNQHLICNHILAKSLYPGMIEGGYGRIINIISTSVKQPLPNLGVSNTIRGAVANWSKTLANELGEYGITVNNVLPGATMTSRLQTLAEIKADQSGRSIEDILTDMGKESPMKRVALPKEVAAAVAFLASPAASYINGINVPVDGGRTKSL
jgi:3-oxoacyl-[acyl-carrier protein] reductase